MRSIIFLLIVIALLSTEPLFANSARIQVNAILNNAAVLTINGQQQMLKKGTLSREGFKLIKIDDDKVTLLISGQPQDYKLGAVITSSKAGKDTKQQVKVSRDNQGMYFTSGTINNFPVNFLIDTGATFIAINSTLANQIGIDYRNLGKPTQASTASGLVTAWKLMLDQVTIGGVELQLVDAAVIEGDFPINPLLGMSFLSRVKMQDDGLLLTIEEKF